MLSVYHIRFSMTGSVISKPHHCLLQPQTGSDMYFYCRLSRLSIIFFIFKPTTDIELISVSVLQKPTWMVPTLNVDSVVVSSRDRTPFI